MAIQASTTESTLRQEIITLLPRLRRFAYALSGSPEQADDIVQAACLRALSRLHQFTPGTRLDSWMFRIVQTTFVDQGRARARRPTASDDEALGNVADDARIHERTEARAALAIVRDEMAKLPEEQRIVLSLVAIEGLSYQEAADTLEIPIGTVMSRLSRARRRLADAIDPA
ncbi:MAG TPA: sigma-70 family RNA polymerase sigma factor [Hyphomicrobiaceae bacterium]|nr:sigma-70 family RNA polymerase sigma factor [Hyphomicrobiaceae bacterium]